MKNLVKFKFITKKIINKVIQVKISKDGYSPSVLTGQVDNFTNIELDYVNTILDWQCFTSDINGRRVGGIAWKGKRTYLQDPLEKRILLMDKKYHLKNKSILELGCFEGVHTLGLMNFSLDVTAVDARVDHVFKTIVRCSLYNKFPKVFRLNLELYSDYKILTEYDLVHHVGVLYHLSDPVSHLNFIGQKIKYGMMLDTHIADSMEALESYEVNGVNYEYQKYTEYGENDNFSGMMPFSKWLSLDSLELALKNSGFNTIEIVENRLERNGTRVLIFADK
jgi:2-polyprenyl-3-methyl-5-hydroxy-6-metoxy-1,4-benzoquinol methylase